MESFVVFFFIYFDLLTFLDTFVVSISCNGNWNLEQRSSMNDNLEKKIDSLFIKQITFKRRKTNGR